MTGQSSASITPRRSISKQRGAEMSPGSTAPKDGRNRISVSTISSGSLVSSTIGIESSPPNVLNRALLPSITGSEAPRADIAEAEHGAAVTDHGDAAGSAHVYFFASVASAAIARLT